ncbi:MAG: DNA repair protein RadA [Treponema sp.]|jgi:DNA repair protein RadA/Sms|nr:DNA repair protein RadA [Treponema sp.]
MKKKDRKTVFRCSSCSHEEPKWLGRCPECGEWNTLVETASVSEQAGGFSARNNKPAQSLPLSVVDPSEGIRISSGVAEFDRVLGGGVMKRSSVLLGGEPGIGKSTLLLQIAASAQTNGRILYVSGEESSGQLRMRADRLGLMGDNRSDRIEVCCTGALMEIETVLNAVKPVMVIVDSAQTLHTDEAGPIPGTVNQMKFCSWELISWIKEHDAILFLVAHITKEGVISGPKTLEHMVDTVLYFEQNDADSRFLRASKNRFGSVDEIGIFTMTEKGLAMVEDPSHLFLVRREGELPPGVSIAAVMEGSRALLVEIQALTVPAKGAMNRVFSDRIDSARVSRIAATLEKHLNLRLSDQDLYINVAGGIRISEVGVDLALATALYSARTNIPVPMKTVVAGELSLAGEVRPLRRLPVRVKTSNSMGFDRFVGPESEAEAGKKASIAGIIAVKDIKSAVKAIWNK